MLGKCDYDLLGPELGESIRAEDLAVIRSGQPACHRDWIDFADGHRELLETVKTPMFGADGELIGVLGVARDMTALHQAQTALAEREEVYGAIVNQAVDSIVLFDAESCAVLEFNAAAHRNLGYSREAFSKLRVIDFEADKNEARVRQQVAQVIGEGGAVFSSQHRTRSGELRDVRVSARVLSVRGRHCVSAVWSDITTNARTQRMLELSNSTLERVARGQDLGETLRYVTTRLEQQNPEMLCSILLLDEDGMHLHTGAVPSLPAAYCKAIDGVRIGPAAGSCGTAAFTAKSVFVSDIEHSPLWADYAQVALAHGLRACWSVPLLASDGRVMGTFAAYYRMPREAAEHERQQFDSISQLLSIALERHRESSRLAASLEEMRRWYAVTLGRESRVLELKDEVNALLLRLGEPPRYGGESR
jgi:PAS domain S-box-containing protein